MKNTHQKTSSARGSERMGMFEYSPVLYRFLYGTAIFLMSVGVTLGAGEPVLNFAVFGGPKEMELTRAGVEAFNREGHAQVRLQCYNQKEYHALQKEWKDGKKPLPDLLYATSDFLADAGPVLFCDLSGRIESSKLPFNKNILATSKLGGKLYACPYVAMPYVVFYNRDAFREAGLTYPARPDTNSFLELTRKLTLRKDGTVERFGYDSAEWNYNSIGVMLQIFGADYASYGFLDPNRLDRAAKAFRYVLDLIYVHKTATGPKDRQKKFYTGGSVIWINGAPVLAELLEKPVAFDWDVGALPVVDQPRSLCGVLHIAISKTCADPEVAWDFIRKMLAFPERGVPVLEDPAIRQRFIKTFNLETRNYRALEESLNFGSPLVCPSRVGFSEILGHPEYSEEKIAEVLKQLLAAEKK